jgi:ribosomal protein S18 acetylase RimI-like enzyme
MEILKTSTEDLEIMRLMWKDALHYQKERGNPVWPDFPEELILKEIESDLNFKLIAGGKILCYFSIAFSDPVIWRDKEKGDALYLHRGVTAPEFRGLGLTRFIFEWARIKAKLINRKYIRIDTWGSNKELINYYERAGFRHIGYKELGEEPGLPSHYNNLRLAIFETDVE